jgi:glycosyltransferase involved in cell wall biosynthesis
MDDFLPRVCIIMPAFRAAETLEAAVKSVLGQSYRNLLLVLSVYPDDDETRRLALAFAEGDGRVTVVVRSGTGVSNGRNEAIQSADADYYMFLDSDDEYASAGVVEAYVEDARRSPDPALRFGDWVGVSVAGAAGGARVARGWRPSYERLLLDNFIATGTVMVSACILAETGLFDDRYAYAEDWDLWLRISRSYPIRHVPLLALRYRENRLTRPYPRSYFLSEMEIVRRQAVSRRLTWAALAAAHGRHGLYVLRTIGLRRTPKDVLAARPQDLLCIPVIVAYKLWRACSGMRWVDPRTLL